MPSDLLLGLTLGALILLTMRLVWTIVQHPADDYDDD